VHEDRAVLQIFLGGDKVATSHSWNRAQSMRFLSCLVGTNSPQTRGDRLARGCHGAKLCQALPHEDLSTALSCVHKHGFLPSCQHPSSVDYHCAHRNPAALAGFPVKTTIRKEGERVSVSLRKSTSLFGCAVEDDHRPVVCVLRRCGSGSAMTIARQQLE